MDAKTFLNATSRSNSRFLNQSNRASKGWLLNYNFAIWTWFILCGVLMGVCWNSPFGQSIQAYYYAISNYKAEFEPYNSLRHQGAAFWVLFSPVIWNWVLIGSCILIYHKLVTNKAILRQECLDEKLNQTNARLIRENRELSRKINEMKNTFSNYNQLMRELENSQKYLVKEYKKYEKDLDEVREGRNEVKELRELLVREDPFRKPDIIEKLADMKKERKEMEDLYEETLDLVTDAQVVLEKFERARKGIQ